MHFLIQMDKKEINRWINIFLIVWIVILLIVISYVLINLKSSMENYNRNNHVSYYYEKASIFQGDYYIQSIADKCIDSNDKVSCVFYNTKLNYTNHFSAIKNPTELAESGFKGVCRDIATFRFSVLRELNVSCELYLIPNKHLYVVAFENNKSYRIDNNYVEYII